MRDSYYFFYYCRRRQRLLLKWMPRCRPTTRTLLTLTCVSTTKTMPIPTELNDGPLIADLNWTMYRFWAALSSLFWVHSRRVDSTWLSCPFVSGRPRSSWTSFGLLPRVCRMSTFIWIILFSLVLFLCPGTYYLCFVVCKDLSNVPQTVHADMAWCRPDSVRQSMAIACLWFIESWLPSTAARHVWFDANRPFSTASRHLWFDASRLLSMAVERLWFDSSWPPLTAVRHLWFDASQPLTMAAGRHMIWFQQAAFDGR